MKDDKAFDFNSGVGCGCKQCEYLEAKMFKMKQEIIDLKKQLEELKEKYYKDGLPYGQ